MCTHTSKTTKSQCFPLLLWTEVRPVHTPVPDFLIDRPRKLIKHLKDRITSSNEVQADAISVKNLDKGEFLIKISHLTDTAYRLHFGSNEAIPHCDCPDWAQTLLPCKHFVAVMREFKEWTLAKFPEEHKSSLYLTLDRPVLFNSSEMGED